MKIYEKPMAMIETIEVEDVITSSIVALTADEKTALVEEFGTNNVVVFQW